MKKNYVLLGGWSRDSNTYRKLVETAPKENNVYIIPHTSLIPNIKIPSLSEIDSIILQDLKQQNLNHITLIGHSLGGALAISFAASYPEYVSKLILVDSEGIPDRRNFLIVVFNWLKDSIFFHGTAKVKENVKALIGIIKNFPYYFSVARFANSVNVCKDTQQIKTPTLILWGEMDRVVPIENAKELNRLIKNSRLVVLPGMDHDWLIHNPKKLWDNIEK